MRSLKYLFNRLALRAGSNPCRFHIFRGRNPFFNLNDERKYRLMFDVQDFDPKDLSVKVEERKIKISVFKSNEYRNWRDSTKITREYDIPEDVDPTSVRSKIESGVLVIEGDRRFTGGATHVTNKKEYVITVDLNGFKNDEVSVKLVHDKVSVEAKQSIANVANDNSQSKMCRHVTRRYLLPHHVDKDQIKASFGQDGRLVLSAPYIRAPNTYEKDIPLEKSN